MNEEAKRQVKDAYVWARRELTYMEEDATQEAAAILALAVIQRQNTIDDEELRRQGL